MLEGFSSVSRLRDVILDLVLPFEPNMPNIWKSNVFEAARYYGKPLRDLWTTVKPDRLTVIRVNMFIVL